MRVIINCTGGGSHSLMLLDHTTVLDLKKHIERKEGIPVHQQQLLFAGQILCPDSALLLDHLELDKYSLAHEVVVYMQRQLEEPVLVYLCQPAPAPFQMQPEVVEASSPLSNIMDLLKQRQLTCQVFPTAVAPEPAALSQDARSGLSSAGNCSSGGGASNSSTGSTVVGASAILPSCIVVKRQDGSCSSNVRVTENCTLADLQTTIQIVEGVMPSHLSFYQAPDGCLHVVWGPSSDDDRNSHTVYGRSSMPQGTMLAKGAGSSCAPLAALVKEQAVMP